MRHFPYPSTLQDGNLALALAPALTPTGVTSQPNFFTGTIQKPQILARGLLVLGDITTTRYFQYTPEPERDPVISAQGDILRAECFSACNGVYARLDLLQEGFNGHIGHGTTNVDIGPKLRTALASVQMADKLQLNIGTQGLTFSPYSIQPTGDIALQPAIHQRPVTMPDRWVKALGNAAEIHSHMEAKFSLNATQGQKFIMSLPPATGKKQTGWLTPLGISPKPSAQGVYVSGLHRLSALKRVLTNIEGITFYAPPQPGHFMAVVALPFARLTIALTPEAWQGYSGTGALLEGLATPNILESAQYIHASLNFGKVTSAQIKQQWPIGHVAEALSLLTVSGKLGYDAHQNAYFHRELPDDPNRILKDNPRLVGAKKLAPHITSLGNYQWRVPSRQTDYTVTLDGEISTCTCTWYLNHQNKLGPCKHILAVHLNQGGKYHAQPKLARSSTNF